MDAKIMNMKVQSESQLRLGWKEAGDIWKMQSDIATNQESPRHTAGAWNREDWAASSDNGSPMGLKKA